LKALFKPAPLYLAGLIGQRDPLLGFRVNTLFGVDKLVMGIGVGSLAFSAGAWAYERLKERNRGHAYFPRAVQFSRLSPSHNMFQQSDA
jgi:hypothetical protein